MGVPEEAIHSAEWLTTGTPGGWLIPGTRVIRHRGIITWSGRPRSGTNTSKSETLVDNDCRSASAETVRPADMTRCFAVHANQNEGPGSTGGDGMTRIKNL